jgi:hypothetical protein
MLEKRLAREEIKLQEALDNGAISGWTRCSATSITVTVPEFTVRVECGGEKYPYAQPQAFFVGAPPPHPFYWWDTDDEKRATRCTNLANTDFGLFSRDWVPNCTVLHYVQRLQYSLTADGEKEMRSWMEWVGLDETRV